MAARPEPVAPSPEPVAPRLERSREGRRPTGRVDPERLRRIRLVYEDEVLLVVSKPCGLPVHGGAGGDRATLIGLLREASPDGEALTLAHRVDAATSGLVLVAKDRETAAALGAAWPGLEKRYLSFALGRLKTARTIDRPLDDERRAQVPARTHVRPLAALDGLEPACTLVEARLETGRMHQIRRHLAAIGHPVLMDDKHGDFAANKALRAAAREAGAPVPRDGALLHAAVLRLEHPSDGRPLVLSAPLPERWAALLEAAGGPEALAAAEAALAP